ncbi:lysophospholipid acyltransferase family protein [Pontiella agarivorans]|uniref:Lysophospholipid acyltransferase family protein n=1 Tax=Pontiella agarivorans TaxID=3038953 RepID=A0ABU5MU35_9BACT|nr:lysophospholipid acyltransferase family protein [Pontiella agarivorans]MDZ8117728.1 lysophospholipid acyltransferase family protein [Pontiella agarivorans]
MPTFKIIRRTLRKPLETFSFRIGTLLIPLFPRILMIAIYHIAGTVTYYVAKRERTIGLANLNAVFGSSKTPAEKKHILIQSLISFTRTMGDIFWFSLFTQTRTKKYQQFVPEDGPYFEKRAHIIITAHAGNWELIGLESGLRGIDVASVAAVTKNRGVDIQLNTLREKTGMTIIPREGATRTLISRFRNKGKAAFVLDQNTAEKDGGIWVNFLGMPTPVSSAPAHLSYRTGTDIIFAFSQPVKGGCYEAHTGPVITPPSFDKQADQKEIVKQLTQQIMDVISTQIRNHPETWLWSYKHWKQIKPGTDPALYPDYT